MLRRRLLAGAETVPTAGCVVSMEGSRKKQGTRQASSAKQGWTKKHALVCIYIYIYVHVHTYMHRLLRANGLQNRPGCQTAKAASKRCGPAPGFEGLVASRPCACQQHALACEGKAASKPVFRGMAFFKAAQAASPVL